MYTVLPAKRDSDVKFAYKAIRDFESIDHLCINPILWMGLTHKRSIDSHKLKWSVQVNVLLICSTEIQEVKTSIPSLNEQNSLLQRIEKWLYESIYQVQLGQYTLRCIRSSRESH